MPEFQLVVDHNLVSARMFVSIILHERLHLGVDGFHLLGQEVIDIGAFHTECRELLASLVESSPALLRKGHTDIGPSEVHSDRVEVNLLDNLQSECLVTPLTTFFHVPLNNISHHELESQVLTCPVHPHRRDPEDMWLDECHWDIPSFKR